MAEQQKQLFYFYPRHISFLEHLPQWQNRLKTGKLQVHNVEYRQYKIYFKTLRIYNKYEKYSAENI